MPSAMAWQAAALQIVAVVRNANSLALWSNGVEVQRIFLSALKRSFFKELSVALKSETRGFEQAIKQDDEFAHNGD